MRYSACVETCRFDAETFSPLMNMRCCFWAVGERSMQKPLPRPNFILCYLCINYGIACSSGRELCIGERCCKCDSALVIYQVSFFPSLGTLETSTL